MDQGVTRRCRGYSGTAYNQGPHDVPDESPPFYPGKTQCRDCYRAYAADWRAGRTPLGGLERARSSSVSRAELAILDGVKELAAVLRETRYLSVAAAVAKHTVFLHPDTVAQTHGAALFPVVRDMARRGLLDVLPDGRRVLLDDNTSPTLAFLWAAGRKKGPDVQFNHVWDRSRDPDAYTALWNLCATPAFLAKTTDGSNHPEVTKALRYHSYRLYGYLPAGLAVPTPPDGYDDLVWAPHPEPVFGLATVIRDRLRQSPKSRPSIACREIGWLFSDGRPDQAL